MKKVKHIISTLVWAVVGLYIALVAMANIPIVQSFIGDRLAAAVGKKLGTEVHLGKVSIGFFNRVIIDDVSILDQQGKHLLRSARMSAKLSYLDLVKGNIVITSAQLFSLDANLYRANTKAKPNFQFVIDSLQSKDTTNHKPFSLAINSLIIRRGRIAWNQLDAPRKKTFDINHIEVSDISSHIIANAIGSDSLNINVKNLALNEASGIHLKSLSLKAASNKNEFSIRDFKLITPNSEINIPDFSGSKTNYKAEIAESHILLSELAPFVTQMKGVNKPVVFTSTLAGSDKNLIIKDLKLAIPSHTNDINIYAQSDLRLLVNGKLSFYLPSMLWKANIRRLTINTNGLKLIADNVPNAIVRVKDLQFAGSVGGYGKNLDLDGKLLSDAGNASLDIHKQGDNIHGHLQTPSFNLRQILSDKRFGLLAADIRGEGNLKSKDLKAKGVIGRFDYNNYSYHNINLDGSFINGLVNGKVKISDPNLTATMSGSANIISKLKKIKIAADITNLAPAKLNLATGRLAEANYSGKINANFNASNIHDASGFLKLGKFTMKSANTDYSLDSLHIKAGGSSRGHYIGMRSDFGFAVVYGHFDYAHLPQVVQNIIVRKLPSITNLVPFKYRPVSDDFSIRANINRSDWLKAFFNIPLEIKDSLNLTADVTNHGNNVKADLSAPDITYSSYHLKNIKAKIETVEEQLHANISLTNQRNEIVGTDMNLNAVAGDNLLNATLAIDNHAGKDRLRGELSSYITFKKDNEKKTLAELNVQKSHFFIGDTLFNVQPSTVVYSKKHLKVNSFAITSGNQSLRVDGAASPSSNDSLTAEMKNINVEYILNLVNFHSVDFSGAASGTAHISQLFSKPLANAQLRVDDFRMEGGRLGTLNANVNWNPDEGQIDIDAVANDTIGGKDSKPRYTFVKGYVSPKRNYIDLGINLKETRAELIEGFCSSFIDNVDLSGNGNLRVWGDLSKINLTGKVTAHGSVRVTPLGVRYKMQDAVVNFTEDEIQFDNDSIYDPSGNLGVVTGAIHHRHLGHLTYGIDVDARNLLAYNFDGSDGSTFYGKVYGTGNASIKGRAGEVDIDVNMRPEANSEIVYDISTSEGVGSQNFIQWLSRDSVSEASSDSINGRASNTQPQAPDIPADIRMSFLINALPNATLKIITDKTAGDYITLNGSGSLRATYFNKGALNIFGTYTVERGLYKLTIQNVIKRMFIFAQGGTITFGGDPYNALLNLKAQYPIASVSLSDLQLGRSFSSNNIRVNCLMNITGTPSAPNVDFNLDFPTLSADQQQMISSVINGDEEMNQQVLYLLAVGRFYSRGTNNAETQGASQTSLAMQSILSGELSQQINNVIGSLVKNNDWNFGANISTGDEGWNNAEYEGLLSGRMLNNRLLFNGQFGYRDNANATQSFIGDFDVRYLVVPNGNFSVHVYNKTNDRYFTRNSLNTQGIGFILKKDFSSLRDLFRWGKKDKEKKK